MIMHAQSAQSVITVPVQRASPRKRHGSSAERPPLFILISSEHGGNRIPPEYRKFFRGAGEVLRSHRGYDAGSLAMAHDYAEALDAPLIASTTSRLLIDLNRSLGHPNLYSEFSREIPRHERQRIVERHYLPHRSLVEATVAQAVMRGFRVLHICSHSFTPVYNGEERNADIGLLYDPSRKPEREFCRQWQARLGIALPHCRIRLNYPYAGKLDGLATHLRRQFASDVYIGLEVEINQKHVKQGGRHWRTFRERIIEALRATIASSLREPAQEKSAGAADN
jgi:predicted N-formylglutamate amidohydrolase